MIEQEMDVSLKVRRPSPFLPVFLVCQSAYLCLCVCTRACMRVCSICASLRVVVRKMTGRACQVIVVGNGRVGKTSMITRFARGVSTDQYKKTIGTGRPLPPAHVHTHTQSASPLTRTRHTADFMEKEITLSESGENVKLMLWVHTYVHKQAHTNTNTNTHTHMCTHTYTHTCTPNLSSCSPPSHPSGHGRAGDV